MKTRNTIALGAMVLLCFGVLAGWISSKSTDSVEAMSTNGATYQSGPFKVAVSMHPTTPQVGKNHFTVKVQDVNGRPVTEAQIKAYGEMPAMGAMAAMRAPADLEEVEPGVYSGPLNLEMRGEWLLSLHIEKAGLGETRLGIEMATGREGLMLASGGVVLSSDHSSNLGVEGSHTSMSHAAMAPSADEQQFYTAGNFKLKVVNTSLSQGRNTLRVHLKQTDSSAWTNTHVRAVAQPAASKQKTDATPVAHLNHVSNGLFEGELTLPSGGEFTLALDVDAGDDGHGDLILSFTTDIEGFKPITTTPEGIAYYTCSMHPSVREAGPGQCPICSMDLTPVSKKQVESGEITIDEKRRQMIGVQTNTASVRTLSKSIRAVGKVAFDERRISNITLKFDAWISNLKTDFVGAPVEKGQTLFSVYSPELLSAQEEYLQARRYGSNRAKDSLIDTARRRLLLFDVSEAEVRALETRGRPLDYLPITSPTSGVVIEKHIVDGSAMKTGETLLRIADLTSVWIEAEVYEADLPLLQGGMAATVTLPMLDGREIKSTVEYIYPYLNGDTRTARIRLTLPNTDGSLKPDMFADVRLDVDLGQRLVVPEQAVLFAGQTRVVFKDLGQGKLKPVRVKTGLRSESYVEIVEGLAEGDSVVTSGNFLIASEARLKTGIDQW